MLKWLCNNYIKNEGRHSSYATRATSLSHIHTHAHFLRYTTPFQKIVYQWELIILIQIRVPQFSSTKRQLKFSTLKIFWRKRNLKNIPLWWKVSLCTYSLHISLCLNDQSLQVQYWGSITAPSLVLMFSYTALPERSRVFFLKMTINYKQMHNFFY